MLNIVEIKTAGIELKDDFRWERKEARAFALQHQYPRYIPNFFISNYELICKNGVFFDKPGKPADGKYNFIRALNGKIYVSNILGKNHVRNHSGLSNGKKVTSAGTMIFFEGKLEVISNESGHYKPTNEEMLVDIKHFLALSNNDQLIYEDHSQHKGEEKSLFHYSAIEFVDKKAKTALLTPIQIWKNQSSNFYKTMSSESTHHGKCLVQSTGSQEEEDDEAVENASGYIEKQGFFAHQETRTPTDHINSSYYNLNCT